MNKPDQLRIFGADLTTDTQAIKKKQVNRKVSKNLLVFFSTLTIFACSAQGGFNGATTYGGGNAQGVTVYVNSDVPHRVRDEEANLHCKKYNKLARLEGCSTGVIGGCKFSCISALSFDELIAASRLKNGIADREAEAKTHRVKSTRPTPKGADPSFDELIARMEETGSVYTGTKRKSSAATSDNKRNSEGGWLDVLVAGAVLYGIAELADSLDDDSSSKPAYDFSDTQGLSSSQLGAELLRQKHSKGIRGKGRVVQPLQQYPVTAFQSKPIPNAITQTQRGAVTNQQVPRYVTTKSPFGSQPANYSGCSCTCVDGKMTQLCTSATSVGRICSGTCPSVSNHYQPTNVDVPPAGTELCEYRQVFNSQKGKYETASVCR